MCDVVNGVTRDSFYTSIYNLYRLVISPRSTLNAYILDDVIFLLWLILDLVLVVNNRTLSKALVLNNEYHM